MEPPWKGLGGRMKPGDLVKLVYVQGIVGEDKYWKRWGLKAGDLGIILKFTATEIVEQGVEALVYVTFPLASAQHWIKSENLMKIG